MGLTSLLEIVTSFSPEKVSSSHKTLDQGWKSMRRHTDKGKNDMPMGKGA